MRLTKDNQLQWVNKARLKYLASAKRQLGENAEGRAVEGLRVGGQIQSHKDTEILRYTADQMR